MSKIDDGGPVYPGPKVIFRQLKDYVIEDTKGHNEGISRRDWLAGLAMQGLLSSMNDNHLWAPDQVAASAYMMADEMIKRGKE